MKRRQNQYNGFGTDGVITMSKPQRPPNILLFFPDQHRGDYTEVSGNQYIKTPNIKQLADRGIAFTHAVCPSPICAPSRACLALGREYDHVRIINNGQDCPNDSPLFYKYLQDAGYHTMGCGKFDLNKASKGWGRDGQQIINGVSFLKVWGFSDAIDNAGKPCGARVYIKRREKTDPYLAYLEAKGLASVHASHIQSRRATDSGPTPISDEDYADNYIARNGLMLLNRAPRDKPWFLQVNFTGAHYPWDATENMLSHWKDVKFPPPNDKSTPPKYPVDVMRGVQQNYAAMIENIDQWLGKYIEVLKERGDYENTIIIYASDHGEMLGDHGLMYKDKPYHPSINVPLVIAGPRIVHRAPINHPIALIHIIPTLLEYAMGSIPLKIQHQLDITSQTAYWEGKTEELPKYVRSGFQRWRMVMRDRYKLIVGYLPRAPFWYSWLLKIPSKRSPLLFNLDTDPGENTNIASEHPEIVKELKSHLLHD